MFEEVEGIAGVGGAHLPVDAVAVVGVGDKHPDALGTVDGQLGEVGAGVDRAGLGVADLEIRPQQLGGQDEGLQVVGQRVVELVEQVEKGGQALEFDDLPGQAGDGLVVGGLQLRAVPDQPVGPHQDLQGEGVHPADVHLDVVEGPPRLRAVGDQAFRVGIGLPGDRVTGHDLAEAPDEVEDGPGEPRVPGCPVGLGQRLGGPHPADRGLVAVHGRHVAVGEGVREAPAGGQIAQAVGFRLFPLPPGAVLAGRPAPAAEGGSFGQPGGRKRLGLRRQGQPLRPFGQQLFGLLQELLLVRRVRGRRPGLAHASSSLSGLAG
ncbi:MAG: hypothetical protein BWY73_01515 [candidate division TA06 bacterium ADurb.Bin417]|uniref:Uncharacterized protein n=1 Tax=candidate division TA06 bacterium ADurb.Bin417 TaxID=1852828 RepID=A0A1V5M845_UNCT6|nr:MAG: hypothetical protein BWY73_01515 [candidate division TA06 bacterium ADurb.Bin417]